MPLCKACGIKCRDARHAGSSSESRVRVGALFKHREHLVWKTVSPLSMMRLC